MGGTRSPVHLLQHIKTEKTTDIIFPFLFLLSKKCPLNSYNNRKNTEDKIFWFLGDLRVLIMTPPCGLELGCLEYCIKQL